MKTLEMERLESAAAVLKREHTSRVEFGIVLGSGLGSFAETLKVDSTVPYANVPTMPKSGVAGHVGRFVLGELGGRRVCVMQGRVHLYEGHSVHDVVFGTRLMVKLGASTVIFTNAAGGIDENMRPGDLMLIEDHINLTGHNCLVGVGDDPERSRFVDMTQAYDGELRRVAKQSASEQHVPLHTGVYAGVLGPSYETPAEIRMLRALGAHAVGMSTVLEVIAARHLGARCLGISCITNLASGLGSSGPLSHDEVQEVSARSAERMAILLTALISESNRSQGTLTES